MFDLEKFVKNFSDNCLKILGTNLTGVYLHGSAVMGCFNEKKSDVDLIVVVEDYISDDIKRRFMDMVIELNTLAPEKGIEMSIVRHAVCNPFIYPTPFELHFSNMHINWYKTDPNGYIKNMNGTDKDLAAHFTIINHHGRVIFGEDISRIFGEVPKADYFDSIWNDIESADEDIEENPVYIILNLTRVLAYKKESLVLSKAEGGAWGLVNIPQYRDLIKNAMDDYAGSGHTEIDFAAAHEYAGFMLGAIRK